MNRPRGQNPIGAGVLAAVVAVIVLLAVAALVFTNASTSDDLVRDAIVLQHAEATLGENDVTLKSLSQAVLLGEDLLLGVADADTVARAVDEANRNTGVLRQRAEALRDALGDGSPELQAAIDSAVTGAREVIALTAAGDAIAAGELLRGDAKAGLERLRDRVSVYRDEAAVALADAGHFAGTMANIAKYLLALLIPAAAILTYQRIARRQLRFAEVQLDARLSAEREVVRAKDEFIANISHELRTPLTSIYGFSELLLEQGLIDPEYSLELIAMINSESGELTRMVEDLLTSARADAGSMMFRPAAIDVASEVEAAYGPFAASGLEVEVDCSSVAALADPLRVRQILRNLMSNAQRHGGPHVQVLGRVTDGRYIVTVADDGPGVPEEMRDRLFARFVHEGENPLIAGSVGLGLAVVKILAEGMGGQVWHERASGWTMFSMALPLAEAGAVGGAWEGVAGAAVIAASEPLPTELR